MDNNLDWWAEYKVWEVNGTFDEKGTVRSNKQDEITAKHQEKMLLVLEKDEFPTKDAGISSSIRETHIKLL